MGSRILFRAIDANLWTNTPVNCAFAFMKFPRITRIHRLHQKFVVSLANGLMWLLHRTWKKNNPWYHQYLPNRLQAKCSNTNKTTRIPKIWYVSTFSVISPTNNCFGALGLHTKYQIWLYIFGFFFFFCCFVFSCCLRRFIQFIWFWTRERCESVATLQNGVECGAHIIVVWGTGGARFIVRFFVDDNAAIGCGWNGR